MTNPPLSLEFSTSFLQDFYRLLEVRRSIRKFKPQPVPKEVVERILQAGMQAPSGKNFQNWKFYVLTGTKRDEYVEMSKKTWTKIQPILEKQLKPSLYQFTERFFYTLGDAPVVVLCYSNNNPQEHRLTSEGSVYMAVENINLACFAEGLGCCTMGAALEIADEVNRFVGADQLPEYRAGHLEFLCAVVIGFPDHEPPKAPRQTQGRVVYLDRA
jgi:nitroreductase